MAPKRSFLQISGRVAAIYLGLLLLVEIAGQIAIRILESKSPSGIFAEDLLSHLEPVLGFGLKRNLSQSKGSWSVRTNQWGFRSDEDFEATKPVNEIRVFVVGGSTVFGWGVDSSVTIPNQLQELVDHEIRNHFSTTNRKIRIVNAGVPWYASWHEASMIFFRILELKPDWIIVLDGLNDAATGVSPTWTPLYMGFVDGPTRIAYEKKKSQGQAWILNALELSPTFAYFHARLKAKEELKVGVYHPDVWDQYLAYARRLSHVTRTHEAPVRYSIFFQPVMMLDKTLSSYEKAHNGTSMRDPDFAETFRKTYLDGEQRALKDPSLKVTSLKSIFKNIADSVYLDGLHYNALGNRILAEEIFRRELQPHLAGLLTENGSIATHLD